MSEELRNYLDVANIDAGYGKASTGMINMLRGFNRLGGGNILPGYSDDQGFVFFTRPNLNLSYDNVSQAPRLAFLGTDDTTSLGCAIRSLLSPDVKDPRTLDESWVLSVMRDESASDGKEVLPRSMIVDERYPFIPMLSNLLINLSGWPDFTLEAFQSKEGLRKEVINWADSPGDMYQAFDLTATFQAVEGNPVKVLFAAWCEYAARVAEGSMVPYPQCIVEREIDYNLRIYRFVMDPTRQYIRETYEACVCWPSALNNGAGGNFNVERQRAEVEPVSIRFNCTGARYNDPRTLYNFNTVVGMFNPSMRDSKRDKQLKKLTSDEYRLFNYRGYPFIERNNELSWWVTNEEYDRFYRALEGYEKPELGTLADTGYGELPKNTVA